MRSYIVGGMQEMNRRDLPKFVEFKKEMEEFEEENSFLKSLDLLDFRDDLNYK